MAGNPEQSSGISRRALLGAGAAAAVTSAAAGAAALPAASIGGWDLSTDVLVAGSGAAGICAALEAAAAGARVMVIESLARPGGSSAMSGGVIYAGGGTALQKSHRIDDSIVEMYRFLKDVSGPGVPLPKVQLYCEESVAHFDWLLQQGVPFGGGFTAEKGLPMGDESLYFSGTEQAWPARDLARPAPRGHVPGGRGMNGGRKLMEALLARAATAGIRVRTRTSAEHLVTESDGRVVGVLVEDATGLRQRIRVQRGVVLACGGFIHNKEMLALYAPQLADCSVPWGNAGDQGKGINLGISAGAAALRMHEGFAIAPIYPPEHTLAGLIVNGVGQRFVAEDSYHGVLGHHIAFHQGGKAFLVTDQFSTFGYHQDNFPLAAQSNTVGGLAEELRLPRGSLQNTVAYFNRFAARGEDPTFRKSPQFLRPLVAPPFQAWDLSVDRAFFPVHTFGGLHTSIDGEVISSFGEPIPGLYAAGRNTAGLPTAPYIASGLSLGDGTFFGRRAGRAAAEATV